jgi:hypothetical protein
MSTFEDRLNFAKDNRPHRDVTVLLSDEKSNERALLMEKLESTLDDRRLAAASPHDAIRARIAEIDESSVVDMFRFKLLPGDVWSRLTTANPARVEVPVDRRYGYNFDAVCDAAAQYVDANGTAYGVRVEGDTEVPMIVEKKTLDYPNPRNQWRELFAAISGHEMEKIRDAIWELNEYEPQVRLEEQLKRSGAAVRSETN